METTRLMIKRVLALAAIALAVILSFVIVGNNTGGDGNGSATPGKNHGKGKGQGQGQKPGKPKTTKKTYQIKEGDTLTSIAHSTGVSVAKLQKLNPDIDPQALISGQNLKLR